MPTRELPIKNPCSESWERMRGDAVRRYCDKCERDVINLSALTRREAQPILERRAAGERVCVRYTADAAGRIDFRSEPLIPPALLIRGRRLALGAGLFATALNGCLPAGSAAGSAVAHQAADALAERGRCGVSLEPLLPVHVRLSSAACEPRTSEPLPPTPVGALEEVPPPPTSPPPSPPSPPEPPPPPPAVAASEKPAAAPTRWRPAHRGREPDKKRSSPNDRFELLGY